MQFKGNLMNLNVIKRDGSKEPLNIEKIHKVVFWATEGLSGVSASEVEIKSQIQFYNNIESKKIHETLIKAASELISEEATNYQYVAGRLINYQLRKEVYGSYEPCKIYDLIKKNVANGFYDTALLEDYTEEEWKHIDNFIDHNRDMKFAYAAMEQLRGKYLVKNRVTGQIFETPQICYALIAATLFAKYPKETRMQYVKDYYDAVSKFYISLPTPIMAGVRTPQRQFSSCVLIETDDSLKSISKTTEAIVSYVSQKAGIGIGAGRIRAIGSSVRNGDTSHTGVTPFYRLFQTAVRSCSQGGVRNGAATLYVPIFHAEIEDIVVLKNNKGVEENRVRHMDYGIQINKLFYERLIEGGNITLFSPSDIKEAYEAFFVDYDKFKELYERAERNTRIKKKSVPAVEIFSLIMNERKDTGRIYIQNVDNCNLHSSFIEKEAPIRQSNLCLTGDSIVSIFYIPNDPDLDTDGEPLGLYKNIRLNEIGTYMMQYGDITIKSKNINTKSVQYMKVEAFAKTSSIAKVMKITDETTGKSIRVTPDHLVYTKNRGYVKAVELVETDELDVM